ncbi:hypothetical protein [Flavobacterium sp. TSSA_36]|jgi:hypothetical protein|uniref:hypothetical protein n=1 Tax=Flavobacterium sp. TSSA_36 TaxID=3447669 RepID=UPI003F3F0450
MFVTDLPKQPPLFISYLKVGELLYYSLILFILEAWIYGIQLHDAVLNRGKIAILFWLSCFLFSFLHIFLVLADGWSRFQNYKRAKDQFFVHGFNRRICDTYIVSKCQRIAATVAANELGYKDQIDNYYKQKGVKWYHFVPYFMVNDPLFLFRKKFWNRTFLEPSYQSRFDYHAIQIKITQ